MFEITGHNAARYILLDFLERIALDEGTNEDIFTKGAQISEWSREQFADFVIHLQKILRDIFLLGQMELYNLDFEDRLREIKISEKEISAMIEAGVEVGRQIKSNANLRLIAEAYLMRLKLIHRKS